MVATTSTTSTGAELLAAVEGIRPVIEKHGPEGEELRRLPDPIYDAMIGAGLFRMLIPKAYGGLELHPVEAYRVWEAVARIDAAAGWNLAISSGSLMAAGWLSAEAADEVFEGGPDTIGACAFFPPAAGRRVEGGWRATGRLPFSSGSNRAAWYFFPVIEMDGDAPKLDPDTGQPVVMFATAPRADVTVVDTWHTLGMRGTGSNDLEFTDIFLPAHRVGVLGPMTNIPPKLDTPVARISPWQGVHGETIASLGVAGAAIDKLVALASTKTPAMSASPLRDREMVQHHAARARALLDASRAYLHASISEAYAFAERGEPLTTDVKVRCQLAGSFGSEACAEAVRLVHEVAGSSGMRIGAGFERHFRDAHTLSQHASKSYVRYASVGQLLFGLPSDWFALNI